MTEWKLLVHRDAGQAQHSREKMFVAYWHPIHGGTSCVIILLVFAAKLPTHTECQFVCVLMLSECMLLVELFTCCS